MSNVYPGTVAYSDSSDLSKEVESFFEALDQEVNEILKRQHQLADALESMREQHTSGEISDDDFSRIQIAIHGTLTKLRVELARLDAMRARIDRAKGSI